MKTISNYDYKVKLDLISSKVKGLSPSSAGASFTQGRLILIVTFGISLLKLRQETGDESDVFPSSSS